MMRPTLNEAELRPTALGRSSGVDHLADERLPGRRLEGGADAEEQREDVDVPLLRRRRSRRARRARPRGAAIISLGRAGAAAAWGSGRRSTPANGESSRIGRNCRPGGDAEGGAGVAGQQQDQPVLGDALHPGADVGHEAAGGVQPVVAVREGAERRAQACSVAQPLEDRGGLAQQRRARRGSARAAAGPARRRGGGGRRRAAPGPSSVRSTTTWRPSVGCGAALDEAAPPRGR